MVVALMYDAFFATKTQRLKEDTKASMLCDAYCLGGFVAHNKTISSLL